MKNLEGLGFSNYCVTCNGEVYSLRAERFLSIADRGYQMIGLVNDEGKSVNTYIHRLVAFAYCEGYCPDLQVNHIDGCKGNNHYKNLEWVTRSENMIHAFRNDLVKGMNPLKEETVHKVCRFLENGGKPSEISDMLAVPQHVVMDILKGKTFKYISSEYNFSKVSRKFRMSEGTVLKICSLIKSGKSNTEISKELGVRFANVRRIRHRITFKYLTDQFDW
jgi:hypothetical protein